MNKIIVSSWVAPLYCDLEIYLDNADKIILKYKQTKNLPPKIKSENGNEYSTVANDKELIGFIKLN